MNTYFVANDITGRQGKEACNLLGMCGLTMYGIICSTFGDSIEGNCLNLLGTGRENHPELLATLSGGQTFSNLDLSHVYQQVSKQKIPKCMTVFMTKITHKGLYKYTRILFRDASAPARLQCIMETLQQELQGICLHLDDVLVTCRLHN